MISFPKCLVALGTLWRSHQEGLLKLPTLGNAQVRQRAMNLGHASEKAANLSLYAEPREATAVSGNPLGYNTMSKAAQLLAEDCLLTTQ